MRQMTDNEIGISRMREMTNKKERNKNFEETGKHETNTMRAGRERLEKEEKDKKDAKKAKKADLKKKIKSIWKSKKAK